MSSQTVVIFTGVQQWQMAFATSEGMQWRQIPVDQNTQPIEIAHTIVAALRDSGLSPNMAVLALSSELCLSATLPLADLRKQTNQTLGYRLEAELPLSAEEFSADFIVSKDVALGICVRTGQITPLIDALEDQGLSVQVVAPAAILALESLAGRKEIDNDHVLIWVEENHLNLFILEDSQPIGWYLLPAESPLLIQFLSLQRLRQQSLKIACINLAVPVYQSIAAGQDWTVRQLPDETRYAAAAQSAMDLAETGRRPSLNLRRGSLGEADLVEPIALPLRVAIVAVATLVLILCSALFCGAHQYDLLSADLRLQQRQVFAAALPNQTIPPAGVLLRLAGEERRLKGLSGDGSQFSNQPSALELLYEVMRRVPQNVRFRLLELRLNDQELDIEGETRSHADADVIASALRTQKGFSVDSPQSEQTSNRGVTFTITGSPNHADQVVKEPTQ